MNNSFNQAVIFHFALSKNDRVYVFQVSPGSPWDEIDEVFNEFKVEFKKLKEAAAQAEEDRKLQKEVADSKEEVAQGE